MGSKGKKLCILTYFFKLYQIFFKSAFLQVSDITIFSNGISQFFQMKFLTETSRIGYGILTHKMIKQGWIRGKYQDFFNRISHSIVLLAIMVGASSIWLFIEISVFLIVLSGKELNTFAKGTNSTHKSWYFLYSLLEAINLSFNIP